MAYSKISWRSGVAYMHGGYTDSTGADTAISRCNKIINIPMFKPRRLTKINHKHGTGEIEDIPKPSEQSQKYYQPKLLDEGNPKYGPKRSKPQSLRPTYRLSTAHRSVRSRSRTRNARRSRCRTSGTAVANLLGHNCRKTPSNCL